MTTNSPIVPNWIVAPASILAIFILAFVYAQIDNRIMLFSNAIMIGLAASLTFGSLLVGIVHLSTSLVGFKNNKQKVLIGILMSLFFVHVFWVLSMQLWMDPAEQTFMGAVRNILNPMNLLYNGQMLAAEGPLDIRTQAVLKGIIPIIFGWLGTQEWYELLLQKVWILVRRR
jgi:hypothetical protein